MGLLAMQTIEPHIVGLDVFCSCTLVISAAKIIVSGIREPAREMRSCSDHDDQCNDYLNQV